ncbi:hypothetical protein XHV734_1460 [Xanthomonas hortorum pv. vitians]|nr:hypothetical protein XHV734_1460 [Xanthomonas hortorum pv. vitians]
MQILRMGMACIGVAARHVLARRGSGGRVRAYAKASSATRSSVSRGETCAFNVAGTLGRCLLLHRERK